MYVCMHVCMYYDVYTAPGPTGIHTSDTSSTRHSSYNTAIPIIIEGQFQVFQRFSSSKLVLEAVESCFVALNYYGNQSTVQTNPNTLTHKILKEHTHTYMH
jgi:hypothetical protein